MVSFPSMLKEFEFVFSSGKFSKFKLFDFHFGILFFKNFFGLFSFSDFIKIIIREFCTKLSLLKQEGLEFHFQNFLKILSLVVILTILRCNFSLKFGRHNFWFQL